MEFEKDFKNWATEKEKIHFNKSENNTYFYEKEIWWCQLGTNIGFEQDGKGTNFSRPVLVLKKFNKSIFLAIPLSGKIKSDPYSIVYQDKNGNRKSAVISQIRLVSAKRLIYKIERMESGVFLHIKKATKDML